MRLSMLCFFFINMMSMELSRVFWNFMTNKKNDVILLIKVSYNEYAPTNVAKIYKLFVSFFELLYLQSHAQK